MFVHANTAQSNHIEYFDDIGATDEDIRNGDVPGIKGLLKREGEAIGKAGSIETSQENLIIINVS